MKNLLNFSLLLLFTFFIYSCDVDFNLVTKSDIISSKAWNITDIVATENNYAPSGTDLLWGCEDKLIYTFQSNGIYSEDFMDGYYELHCFGNELKLNQGTWKISDDERILFLNGLKYTINELSEDRMILTSDNIGARFTLVPF